MFKTLVNIVTTVKLVVVVVAGSCIWLMIATFLRLPVSATHSIVGATLGFALVAHGSKGVQWRQIGLISKNLSEQN